MTTRKLLNDEQVREFIANGFLRLTPDVDANLHKEIEALLRFAVEKEGWYGNNILARVPKMYEVLNCPVVHGAVSSIAGPDYYLHPHRAVHNSTPIGEAAESIKRESLDAAVNAPPMGKGSRAGSGWHQDAQSRCLAPATICPATDRLLFSARNTRGDGADAHTSGQPSVRQSGRTERRGAPGRASRHVLSAPLRHGSRGLS